MGALFQTAAHGRTRCRVASLSSGGRAPAWNAGITVARALTDRLAEQLEPSLRPEAEHLAELCNELLKRVETGQPPPATAATICPSCGHELAGSPVRCRSCGELLV